MRQLAVIALLCAAVPLAAAARSRNEDIRDPVTVELETKASSSQIKKAVKTAVLARRWTISNEKGNSFDATYERPDRRNDLMAKVRISYGKTVTIKYVDSSGLDYDAGSHTINRYYNAWVGNLEKDIPIFVEREVVASE